MRDTEIEKEALLIILACEQFSDYIQGKTTAIKTNHKPLVPLLSTEHHPECFVSAFNWWELMRNDYSIIHPYEAIVHHRHPFLCLSEHFEEDLRHSAVAEAHMAAILSQLPANEDHLNGYREAQAENPTCVQAISYCTNGWPEKHVITGKLQHSQACHNLTIGEGLLLHQSHIVVLDSLQY